MQVLVTGAFGFVGKNLCVQLKKRPDVQLKTFGTTDSLESLHEGLANADIVFHLAGVNRPENLDGFRKGNALLTETLCASLLRSKRNPKVIFTSTTQAELSNPYGLSKLEAERALAAYAKDAQAEVVAYRLKNLFGKWCRPNYNSVTTTFCHNIARNLPITISDPAKAVDLTYIDDVVGAFLRELDGATRSGFGFGPELPSTRISLGELAECIKSFRLHRESLQLPDFSSPFERALYATYLSYVPPEEQIYALASKSDPRGSLAEFVKSPHFGQIFVSRTKPGITRGNHYHHTKTEKFMVVQGDALIRLRHILGSDVTEFRVNGTEYRVVDIPPGYTHSIENVGQDEMVTLFWSSEVFDPARPDTIADPVLPRS